MSSLERFALLDKVVKTSTAKRDTSMEMPLFKNKLNHIIEREPENTSNTNLQNFIKKLISFPSKRIFKIKKYKFIRIDFSILKFAIDDYRNINYLNPDFRLCHIKRK